MSMTTSELGTEWVEARGASLPTGWVSVDDYPLIGMLLDTITDLQSTVTNLQCRMVELERCVGGCA